MLRASPTPATPSQVPSLRDADAASYALVCEALGGFDVRERIAEIRTPLLAIAGADDVATPAADLRRAATAVDGSRFVELRGVAHLAPAEAPDRVVELVVGHVLLSAGTPVST